MSGLGSSQESQKREAGSRVCVAFTRVRFHNKAAFLLLSLALRILVLARP